VTGTNAAGATTPDEQLVLSERRGPVLVLTLNRPERLNAWTNELEDEYFDHLEAAEADPDIRAIVVTGAGRGFCAGADLKALSGVPSADDAEIDRARPRHLPLAVRKPLIAAVNGPAVGLGFVEAMYCDVRFASPAAVFTTTFSRLGLIAEYGISWLLPRIVGRSRALDLLLSGRRVPGEEAYRIGLVDHIVPAEELVDAAVAYATELATACSPWAMATIKEQVALDAESTFLEAADRSDDLMRDSFRGPDIVEGLTSFAERRPPVFQAFRRLQLEEV
jgi:enoyl-CoA hydratase/carnithine racemase